jgi:hypothetical protein
LFRPAVNELLLLKMHLKRKCVIFNTVGVGAEGCLNIHFGTDCNMLLRYSPNPPPTRATFGRVVGATMMRSISSHIYPQRHHHEIRQPRDKHSQPKIRQHGRWRAAATADVALCAAAALCAATTAAAPPPCCRRCCTVALPPPPQHPRCCHRAAAVALCPAAALCAAAAPAKLTMV